MYALSEKDIENSILDWLNRHGVFSFKINTTGIFDGTKKVYRNTGKFTLKGTSDILGVMKDGTFLAIEVKSKIGVVSKEQKAFINRVIKNGGIAFVARSIKDVEEQLHEKLQG